MGVFYRAPSSHPRGVWPCELEARLGSGHMCLHTHAHTCQCKPHTCDVDTTHTHCVRTCTTGWLAGVVARLGVQPMRGHACRPAKTTRDTPGPPPAAPVDPPQIPRVRVSDAGLRVTRASRPDNQISMMMWLMHICNAYILYKG